MVAAAIRHLNMDKATEERLPLTPRHLQVREATEWEDTVILQQAD